ncbi:LacI family transcriptional regulator [Bacillus sp. SB49]|uniref:LacI family DNA-binding transcriptional regulator n=1 Tax=Bacillaceae TaxID=186817 RepID=UPI00041098AD|nr:MULTISPECIES: LacI family DNA-binding transcriptional regulator [Bacillaceae]QHT47970.1 LacI family transcriptional regulator [Bacillus sp. SB49]
MKPKIQDVAKEAGVSPTTVSRVLNNRGYISEETKGKVYAAMEKINYIPNDLARSLFTNRTNVIGLIVPTTENPFFGEIAAAIESACSKNGYKVLLCNSLNELEKEKNYWEMLRRHQVDGVIVGTYNRGLFREAEHPLPIVAIDHFLSPGIPVVGSDNYAGGKLATETLIEKGCRKIVHIHGPVTLETPANKRKQAYEDVIAAHGLSSYTFEIKEILDEAAKTKRIEEVFDQYPDADGVFASDDLVALTILNEARKRGILVPEELKVVGYDGTKLIRSVAPGLSTICQPVAAMAEKAVRMLQDQIENADFHAGETAYLDISFHEGMTT